MQTFVTNLYRELLGREPDASGLSFWVDLLQNGTTRTTVSTDFMQSSEYASHFVTAIYENFLHRAPDLSGLQYWAGVYESSRSELVLLSLIVASDEYFALNGGTNQGFVTGLYRDLLGRPADTGGEAFWVGILDSNPTLPRDRIVLAFLLGNEGINKFVDGNYQSLSGNTPLSPPGQPQGGPYALANITGNGYDNLFFQGTMTQAEINSFIALLRIDGVAGSNDIDALIGLLASPHYFG